MLSCGESRRGRGRLRSSGGRSCSCSPARRSGSCTTRRRAAPASGSTPPAQRPVLIVELARNRGAHGPDEAELELWRASGSALGRGVERFSGASLAEHPLRARCAAGPAGAGDTRARGLRPRSGPDLALGGGVVLSGRAGSEANGKSALAKLFPARASLSLRRCDTPACRGPGGAGGRARRGPRARGGRRRSRARRQPQRGARLGRRAGRGRTRRALPRGAGRRLGLAPNRIGDAAAARTWPRTRCASRCASPCSTCAPGPGPACAVLIDGAHAARPARGCRLASAAADAGAESPELRCSLRRLPLPAGPAPKGARCPSFSRWTARRWSRFPRPARTDPSAARR